MRQETSTIPSATNTAAEEWRPLVGVPEVEGIFEVSNFGRVRRVVFTWHKQKEFPCIQVKKGYIRVLLINKGKQYERFVHRLVAFAFIPNPNNYDQINHKDGNKANNHVDNLEWCTAKQNTLHAHLVLGVKPHGWTEEQRKKHAEIFRKRYARDIEKGIGLYTYQSKRRENTIKNIESIKQRRKEYHKKYYLEHRDALRESNKRYFQEHRQYLNARSHERYLKKKGTDES